MKNSRGKSNSIIFKIKVSATTIESDEEELAAEEISRTTSEYIRVYCSATSIATGFLPTEKLSRQKRRSFSHGSA